MQLHEYTIGRYRRERVNVEHGSIQRLVSSIKQMQREGHDLLSIATALHMTQGEVDYLLWCSLGIAA